MLSRVKWVVCIVIGICFFLRAQEPAPRGTASDAPVYNITLITDSAPDFTNIDSYLRSITSQFEKPEQKAVAIFRWSQRLRKQKSYPTEEGHEVLDPIFFFTNYGYTMCGIISGINNSLYHHLGWKGHYVQLGDHTVGECSWDGGKTWHMLDNSTSIYCFNDTGAIASTREIEKNPRYYLENFAPECGTNSVKDLKDQQGWRFGADHPVENQRTLANGVDSFLPPNEIHEDHLATRWGRRFALNLRPHEQYTRYFRNLDAAKPDPRYYRPLNGKDVEGRTDKSIRANGVWHYEPNLTDPATRAQVYSDSGVTWSAEGIKGPGTVTFKVSAGNVVTSAKISLKATGTTLFVSRSAGIQWEPVPVANGMAEVLDPVAGVTEFLVQAKLEGADALLSSIVIETVTQTSRAALPRLARGPNQIQFRLGEQTETITLAPPILGGNHKKTVCEEKSVAVNAKPYFNVATLCPASSNEPAYVTWKIAAPTPIMGVVYGGNLCAKSKGVVSLLHSWDGKSYSEDFKQADMALPYDRVVNQAIEKVPEGVREAYLRYQFESSNDPAKQWSLSGIQTALMTVQHQPRVAGFSPVDVTYCWIEHHDSGEIERSHTQLISSSAEQYSIQVGGFRDPTMKWVRVNLKGHAPTGEVVKYGYSDGNANAVAAPTARAIYRWGKNLALGKPYKLDGKQNEKNLDAGGDLTDGIIMPPDTYTSVKWMPTNVLFAKDVSPVATIDLGAKQNVAAVRISSGQAEDFKMTYPDAFRVETSLDGQAFTPLGSADFKQVFDPPADYVYGECEESTLFDALPAGGRLAYSYRVIPTQPVDARYVRVTSECRKGWGLMLSEIQVFDAVKVDAQIPPAVVLPPLPAK